MSYYLAAAKGFEKTQGFLDKIGEKTGFKQPGAAADADIYPKIAALMNIILGLVGILATIYLIYCGILWIRAGGNEEVVKSAKAGLRSALYGLLVIFSAYVLVNFIINRLLDAVVTK